MGSNRFFTGNKLYLLIALIHWLAVLPLELMFFVVPTFHNIYLFVIKIVFIFGAWQVVGYVIQRYKGDIEFRRYLHYVIIYFFISMVILLLIWPGNWTVDEYHVLKRLSMLQFQGWQHILSSIYYFCALSIFPSVVSIAIFQQVLISFIIGYFVYIVSKLLKESKLTWLAYVPFLFFSVLQQNTLTYRATPFSYLILFFIVSIIFLRNKKIPLTNINIFCLLGAGILISTWRGEGIYFLILVPVLFLIGLWKVTQSIQKICFIIFFVFGSWSILFFQHNVWFDENDRNINQISLYANPFADLVSRASKDGRFDLYKDTAYYINIETFLGEEGMYGAYWSDPNLFVGQKFSDEASYQVKKVYLNLILQYPDTFLENRLKYFRQPLDILSSIENVYVGLQSENKTQEEKWIERKIFGSEEDRYLSKDLRTWTLGHLTLYGHFKIAMYAYNVYIPLTLMLIVIGFLLLKKQIFTAFAIASILPSSVLAFLAAPDPFFMYYFPSYLAGYAFFIALALFGINYFLNKKLNLI